VEELVKLKVDEAVSPMMRKLDDFLACQRKTKKDVLRRLLMTSYG